MKQFFSTFFLLAGLLLFFGNSVVLAAPGDCTGDCVTNDSNSTPSGQTIDAITLPNPLGNSPDKADPRIIAGNIIKVVLGLVGSLALILFIYGGLMMMLSAGNADRVKQGRNTLVWAAIGLGVIFGSYTIVGFLLKAITVGA